MKDSGVEWIGEIPEHWDVRRVKDIANINSRVLSEQTDDNYEFDYVDIGSVTLEKGIVTKERMKFEHAPSRARRIAYSGDIIISTVRTYLKAIAKVNEDEIVASTGFAVITAKPLINNVFLEHCCKSEGFIAYIGANSVGISYPAINSTKLICAKIAVPPMIEQISISNKLNQYVNDINQLIENKKMIIQNLESYKKSLIYEVVTGKREVS
jgi:type I restriction enzyme S subunit